MPALVAWFKERLAARAYLRTVIDDLGEALGRGRRRRMSRIVGIDLGTTNSLVACVDGGVPKVIPDAEGRPCCPRSWRTRPTACSSARRRAGSSPANPPRTIYSVKRLMGRGYEDVEGELAPFPFAVEPAAEVVRIRVGDARR